MPDSAISADALAHEFSTGGSGYITAVLPSSKSKGGLCYDCSADREEGLSFTQRALTSCLLAILMPTDRSPPSASAIFGSGGCK